MYPKYTSAQERSRVIAPEYAIRSAGVPLRRQVYQIFTFGVGELSSTRIGQLYRPEGLEFKIVILLLGVLIVKSCQLFTGGENSSAPINTVLENPSVRTTMKYM